MKRGRFRRGRCLMALTIGCTLAVTALAIGPVATSVVNATQSGHAATPTDQCDGTLPAGSVVGIASPVGDSGGYWIANNQGRVVACGDAPDLGGLTTKLNQPIVGIAPVYEAGGVGYYLVAADGGVFAFGVAVFYGSTGGLKLNSPVVGLAVSPFQDGYWLVAADGGVFSFGDAPYLGSMGGQKLSSPVVGMAVDGQANSFAYWLVAADGGVFAFGAPFFGSAASTPLSAPIVGIVDGAGAGGEGYYLVASDGGVFAYGMAQFLGSAGAIRLNEPIVGMEDQAIASAGCEPQTGPPIVVVPHDVCTITDGYRLVAADGGVFDYGNAGYFGSAS